MKRTLTKADVTQLLSSSSAEVRADTAGKIAAQFEEGILTEKERGIAQDIFRIMVRDAEVRVRKELSSHLKECDELPRDIALSLAQDIDEVALPILQFSEVLTDGDLIEIVRTHGAAKQVAVAQRRTVSAEVADALVETDNEEVVARLVANEGAELSEPSLLKVLDRFGDREAVQDPLVHRKRLPITVAERLVTMVSDALQDHLVTHQDVSAAVASDIIMHSRERATVGLLSPGSGEEDVAKLVAQLRAHGRLTPTIVVRALCTGDIAFFEASLATLAKIPLASARILIHDEGRLGLDAICDKAGLPQALYPATRIAVDVIHETDYDGGPNDRDRYKCRVLERILTQYEELGAIGSENLDYLVGKLGRLRADGDWVQH
jgi:uncharacterized protein (DUF2336 family)